jgi:NAD(P)H-hydrate epimerase
VNKPENALYCCEQIRECEQQAVHLLQFDENELMYQAGAEAFFFMRSTFPEADHIAVFCGGGNNAGDGYILARLAHEHGLSVIVYQCKPLDDLPDIAKNAAMSALAAGVECQSADEPLDYETDLIVDALLGIGIKGPVRGIVATAINQINSSCLPILSIDVPSGLNADTGFVENFCVRATTTITFIAPKVGLYTLDGPDYCGAIQCNTLQLESLVAKLKPCAFLLSEGTISLPLPPRKMNTHKGNFGHVLVIGSGPGMPGAVSLTAKAALRMGAGSVSVATWPEYAKSILPLVPEAMIWGVNTPMDLVPLIAKATVCVIGPGLGESEWAKALFLKVITSQLPMVIDASALRLLAEHPQMDDNWILTPHPGEAGSLLSSPAQIVQRNRHQSAVAIQQLYGGIVVLKGTGTVIQTLEKNTFICPLGNPGMASAGMGDVLSGIIAGLCAQNISLSEAAKLGVWIHALAGDKAAGSIGPVGILASDLLDLLPKVLSCSE